MKTLLSIIFLFVFSCAAYGQIGCGGSGLGVSFPAEAATQKYTSAPNLTCDPRVMPLGVSYWIGAYVTYDNDAHTYILQISTAKNTSAARQGEVEITYKDQISGNYAHYLIYVTQASGCTFTPSATSASASAAGENQLFTIQSNGGCQWQAVSQNDWITINLGASWSGSGTVGYTIAANPSGAARTGTITVAGQVFTVTQSGGKTRKRVRFF